MINNYKEVRDTHFKEYQEIKKKDSWLSYLRLAVILLLVFWIYKIFDSGTLYIYLSVAQVLLFLVLLKVQDKLRWKKTILEKLLQINEEEIEYLTSNRMPWPNGEEFTDTSNSYSYDLDIFGDNSLFQNLNRTSTHMGRVELAEILLSLPATHEILQNQDAIKELTNKLGWRQQIAAITKTIICDKESYTKLVRWSEMQKPVSVTKLKWIAYALPAFLLLCGIFYYFFPSNIMTALLVALPNINLLIFFFNFKKLKTEMVRVNRTMEILKSFSLLIQKMEDEKFNSIKLSALQSSLTNGNIKASEAIKKLSVLFSGLESIHSGVAAILFNGSILYHLHAYIALLQWKSRYSVQVKIWLDIIGEFEALNSMANYAYNNPSFTYPKLNNEYLFKCKELGHPLLAEKYRITNDVLIARDHIIILTGSNMSGKSTFLRTLGVTLVLTSTGAPVCASDATIHPMKVLTSMRQIDSLNKGESYFFAEVKRLKQIMDALEHEPCFVLLDEILKGTNSDDKRSGTMGVVKNLLSKKAMGYLATHDLEICHLASNFPEPLRSQCFEVEIIDNELFFDYKLRLGICKNKSATFLMKKMSVI